MSGQQRERRRRALIVLLLLLLIAAVGALVLVGRPDTGEPAGASGAVSYRVELARDGGA